MYLMTVALLYKLVLVLVGLGLLIFSFSFLQEMTCRHFFQKNDSCGRCFGI